MKILHAILSREFYGSERYCVELATAQARAGHAVRIVVQGGTDCAHRFAEFIAKTGRQDATASSCAGTPRLVALPSWAPALLHRPFARHVIRRFAPDIVHTHLNPAARRVGLEAQTLGIPHVATLHLRYEPVEHAACDGLIAIAGWQRASIPADHPGEMTVIWNWLPGDVTAGLARTSDAEVGELRAHWEAGDSTLVFGSVGRLEPEKGIDRLVAVFRRAFPQGEEPVRLVIVGDGSQMAALRRRAVDDPRIVLAGAQREVAAFYRAFDVYVSAARFEPFGLSILEAMAAGCPLVLSRTDGPGEFVTDARVLWTEQDDAALVDALRQVGPKERQRLAYDLTPFAPERAASAIESFYRRVLAKTTPGQRLRNSDAR